MAETAMLRMKMHLPGDNRVRPFAVAQDKSSAGIESGASPADQFSGTRFDNGDLASDQRMMFVVALQGFSKEPLAAVREGRVQMSRDGDQCVTHVNVPSRNRG